MQPKIAARRREADLNIDELNSMLLPVGMRCVRVCRRRYTSLHDARRHGLQEPHGARTTLPGVHPSHAPTSGAHTPHRTHSLTLTHSPRVTTGDDVRHAAGTTPPPCACENGDIPPAHRWPCVRTRLHPSQPQTSVRCGGRYSHKLKLCTRLLGQQRACGQPVVAVALLQQFQYAQGIVATILSALLDIPVRMDAEYTVSRKGGTNKVHQHTIQPNSGRTTSLSLDPISPTFQLVYLQSRLRIKRSDIFGTCSMFSARGRKQNTSVVAWRLGLPSLVLSVVFLAHIACACRMHAHRT